MDFYTGQIILFAGRFDINGFMNCDGSLLPIWQYTALFSLIGNAYGGDGNSNFALPNLVGRLPMGTGTSTNGGQPGPNTIATAGGLPLASSATANLLKSTSPSGVSVVSGLSPASAMPPSVGFRYLICVNGYFPEFTD